MRASRILTAYLVKEVLLYTLLGFLVFASILLSQNLLRTLADIAETAGATFQEIVLVAAYLLPILATYAVPVSFLFGVLLAIGRMASDSEVVAMRACGVGLGDLVKPVLALGVLFSLGTGFLMIHVEPRVRQEMRVLVKTAASRGLGLETGGFRGLSGRVIHVRSLDADGRLRGVVIWDGSQPTRPFTVFAEEGRLSYEAETAEVRLDLKGGDIHMEPSAEEPDRYRRIAFERFEYEFDVSDLLAAEAARLKPRDMTMGVLLHNLDRVRNATDPSELAGLREDEPEPYLLQLHRRFALPFAPIVFALVAVPLGLRRVRGARSLGAMLCVALTFGYYVLLSFGEYLGEEGVVHPALALWLPNAAFLTISIPLLRRARRGEM